MPVPHEPERTIIMKYYLQATLSAFIQITDEDFKLLWDDCENHYDAKIQSFTKVGGFMYGWKNRRDWAENEEDKEKELTFREIDSLLKAMEMDYTIPASLLSASFIKILRRMNDMYSPMNENLKNETATT